MRGFSPKRFGGSLSGVVGDVRRSFWYRDDFVSGALSQRIVTGTGTSTTGGINPAGRPGGELQSVSVGGDRAVVAPSNSSNTIRLGGGRVSVAFAVSLESANDPGVDECTMRDGLGDVTTGADFVDGVYVAYDPALGTNYFGRTASNSVRSSVDLGVAPTVGAFDRFLIDINAEASSVSFYVNGTLRGSLTANIPSGASRWISYIMTWQNTTGIVVRNRTLDYIEVRQFLNSER